MCGWTSLYRGLIPTASQSRRWTELMADVNAIPRPLTRGVHDVVPIDFNETHCNDRSSCQILLSKGIRCAFQPFAKKSKLKNSEHFMNKWNRVFNRITHSAVATWQTRSVDIFGSSPDNLFFKRFFAMQLLQKIYIHYIYNNTYIFYLFIVYYRIFSFAFST